MDNRSFTVFNGVSEWLVLLMLLLCVNADVCTRKLCICDNNGFVNCSRNELTDVPKDIPLNTTDLDLSINSLTKININDLKHLVNLTAISLSENNLNDNSIQPGALDLPHLDTVDLSFTGMTSIPQVLPKTLKTLYFIQNNMYSMPADSFERTPLLEYVDLSNNKLSAIAGGLFRSLKNLSSVYIAFNQLTNDGIPNDTFVSNEKMQILGLRFNMLKYILPNLPSSLEHLDYVGNKIKTIPSYAFKSLPNLQTLELWNGEVTTLEDHAFSGMPKLEILDMMQDKVTTNITNTTFSGLVCLKTLYFDLNHVSHIDPYAFQTFESISSLWLSGNNLSRADPLVFDSKFMPHLSELNIDFNPWYCDCHLRWLKELSEKPKTFVVQDPHLVVCDGPPSLKGKAWDEIKSSDFVCK